MCSETKAVVGRVGVNVAKELRGGAALVSPDSEADNITVTKMDCQFCNSLPGFDAELAHRVEYPEKRDTEVVLAAMAAAFQSFEDGRKVLLAPETHAYGDVNLGMQDVLGLELLHEAVRDQFVIGRRLQ